MMRVFIAGAGQAGVSVAKHLSNLGHEVSVVDRDPLITRRIFEQHGIAAITGDATDAALLQQAEIGRADVAVSMLARDADNLAVALLAREFGARRVMVRMRDVAYRRPYEHAGVDRILSETEILVGSLAISIEHEAVGHAMILGDGNSVAFDLTINHAARVVGRTVSELAQSADFPRSCVFAAIFDENGMTSPRGNTQIRGGQQVLLVSHREEMSRVVDFFMSRA
ncbi:MAG TPA: TrkA family potassium uptake protein [Polyangiaceae bacterium]|nr:TrkA family potassium uptake protein [Polyangiaceae bacterium]